MHADELRVAVAKIVELLQKSDIRAVIDEYRAARGEARTVAAARLGHASAVIVERIDAMSPSERQVARLLHLEELGTPDYWQRLLGATGNPQARQAEIVRLASRVMFAGNHLPGLVQLLGASAAGGDYPLENGQGRLIVRLSDAGERASDPDRVARSIDGVDMLYSACASIARKPAMDLRLDGIVGTEHRDIHFTGDRDSMSAVVAVIESIPEALQDLDPEQDIDLDAVIHSLPIFEDLNTLASLGTFNETDLHDITATMQQGALLALESGVLLLDPPEPRVIKPAAPAIPINRPQVQAPAEAGASEPPTLTRRRPDVAPQPSSNGGRAPGPTDDEHYARYLREREALQTGAPAPAGRPDTAQPRPAAPAPSAPAAASSGNGLHPNDAKDSSRADAVEELLRSLGRSRDA